MMNCIVRSGIGMFLTVKCVSCDSSGNVPNHDGMLELKEIDDGGGGAHKRRTNGSTRSSIGSSSQKVPGGRG
ncbi:hypothetical protein PMI05_01356 [Brevibacillus sp. BC25]|nr:hypothetical protein PMI05_01356 [Brevibacillus sp. BC25]